jgi:cytochrome c553
MSSHPHLTVMLAKASIGLLLFVATAQAQPAETPLTDCRTCHRLRTPGSGEVPIIEGQHAPYLELQLQYFRERHRESFPMDSVAAGYGSKALVEIAAAASLEPWPRDVVAPSEEASRKGAARAESLGCADCHGADYRGYSIVPRLAGQLRAYLERQIEAIALEEREHPEIQPGTGKPLAPEDAKPIAAFLSGTTHPAR